MTTKRKVTALLKEYKYKEEAYRRIAWTPLIALPCGCRTWKHERNTDYCLEMAEQLLAELNNYYDR